MTRRAWTLAKFNQANYLVRLGAAQTLDEYLLLAASPVIREGPFTFLVW